MQMAIRQAVAQDLDLIHSLLEAGLLPSTGVELPLTHFLVAEQDGVVIGVIGLEHFSSVGLLRSLAVDADHQRRGVARALCQALIVRARELGIATLYALTTTAERFLGQQGFVAVDRGEVPAAIAATAEFRHLCPESASCLVRRIDAEAR